MHHLLASSQPKTSLTYLADFYGSFERNLYQVSINILVLSLQAIKEFLHKF